MFGIAFAIIGAIILFFILRLFRLTFSNKFIVIVIEAALAISIIVMFLMEYNYIIASVGLVLMLLIGTVLLSLLNRKKTTNNNKVELESSSPNLRDDTIIENKSNLESQQTSHNDQSKIDSLIKSLQAEKSVTNVNDENEEKAEEHETIVEEGNDLNEDKEVLDITDVETSDSLENNKEFENSEDSEILSDFQGHEDVQEQVEENDNINIDHELVITNIDDTETENDQQLKEHQENEEDEFNTPSKLEDVIELEEIYDFSIDNDEVQSTEKQDQETIKKELDIEVDEELQDIQIEEQDDEYKPVAPAVSEDIILEELTDININNEKAEEGQLNEQSYEVEDLQIKRQELMDELEEIDDMSTKETNIKVPEKQLLEKASEENDDHEHKINPRNNKDDFIQSRKALFDELEEDLF